MRAPHLPFSTSAKMGRPDKPGDDDFYQEIREDFTQAAR
jgi:hypothetical protein